MTNLLEETKTKIVLTRHSIGDIDFIGDEEFACTWDEFVKLADLDYDSGYGTAHVASDLKIVFVDGSWLAREEYDGSEWWRYYETPVKPSTPLPITRLTGRWGGNLAMLQEEDDEDW